MMTLPRYPLDIATAQRHATALDPSAQFFIVAFIAEAPGRPERCRHRYGSILSLRPEIEAAQAEGYGVFIAVNDFKRHRRRIAELSRWRAVWRELDQPPAPSLPESASLIVSTSGPKVHEYFLIDPANPPANAEAEAINKVLVAEYGGDPNARDGARALRLAGSWHLKREPHRVRIIGGTGEYFRRRDLIRAFPTPPPPPPRPRPAPARFDSPDRYIAAVIPRLVDELAAAAEGNRNASLNRAAFRMGQLGIGLDTAKSILAPVAVGIGLTPHATAATIASGIAAGTANPRRPAPFVEGSTHA